MLATGHFRMHPACLYTFPSGWGGPWHTIHLPPTSLDAKSATNSPEYLLAALSDFDLELHPAISCVSLSRIEESICGTDFILHPTLGQFKKLCFIAIRVYCIRRFYATLKVSPLIAWTLLNSTMLPVKCQQQQNPLVFLRIRPYHQSNMIPLACAHRD